MSIHPPCPCVPHVPISSIPYTPCPHIPLFPCLWWPHVPPFPCVPMPLGSYVRASPVSSPRPPWRVPPSWRGVTGGHWGGPLPLCGASSPGGAVRNCAALHRGRPSSVAHLPGTNQAGSSGEGEPRNEDSDSAPGTAPRRGAPPRSAALTVSGVERGNTAPIREAPSLW